MKETDKSVVGEPTTRSHVVGCALTPGGFPVFF